MVTAGPGMCITFHRFVARSQGTKDCVGRALAAGIPTYLIDSQEARPRRLQVGVTGGKLRQGAMGLVESYLHHTEKDRVADRAKPGADYWGRLGVRCPGS
jgi:hypothetical protein